jgi:hypothetical protein
MRYPSTCPVQGGEAEVSRVLRPVTSKPSARLGPRWPGGCAPSLASETGHLRSQYRVHEEAVGRAESAFGADLAARPPANPITVCDGHEVNFVTATGQILMAVHTHKHVSVSGPAVRLANWLVKLSWLPTKGTEAVLIGTRRTSWLPRRHGTAG